jgi:hypothetical protein
MLYDIVNISVKVARASWKIKTIRIMVISCCLPRCRVLGFRTDPAEMNCIFKIIEFIFFNDKKLRAISLV